jgi:4-alpha-glucanotransferase
VRLDHFRAFEAFWVVPAGAKTAKDGRWEPGPGAAFFEALRERLGSLPFVAEDLGEITPEVHALRERFDLPGMKVLQFGLLDEAAEHHPRQHLPRSVAYTGTHDNDTLGGWLESLTPDERARLCAPGSPEPTPWSIVERAFDSVADTVIVPLQDLLGLGGEARMNLPGVGDGNWGWRAAHGALTAELARRVRRLAEVTGRT